MKLRILVLGGLAALLGAYVLLVELPRQKEEIEQEEAGRIVVEFAPESIDGIWLHRSEGDIDVARAADGEWTMTEPLMSAVDPATALTYASELATMKRFGVVLENASQEQLAEFGLAAIESGAAVIELRRGGRAPIALSVGSQTPSGQACYYLLGQDTDVQSADIALYKMAHASYQGLRERRLFDAADSLITELTLRYMDNAYTAQRGGDGLWYLADEPEQELELRHMRDFAFDITSGRAAAFLRDDLSEDEWRAYGLGDPIAEFRWKTSDGRSGAILMGNEAEQDAMLFARFERGNTLMLLSGQLLEDCKMPLDDLRDINPIDENFPRLREMELVWEDGRSIVARGRGHDVKTVLQSDWDVAEADLHIATRNAFYGIERLRPTGSMETSTKDAAAALEHVALALYLRWEDHERKLRLGWNGSGEIHWVVLDEEATLYQVPRELYFRLRGWLLAPEAIHAGS